jgi:hypothetical protein
MVFSWRWQCSLGLLQQDMELLNLLVFSIELLT